MTKRLMLKKLPLKKLTIKKVDDEKIYGKKIEKSWWWKSWRWKSWRWRSWCWRLYLDRCGVHRLDSPLGCQPLLLTIVVDHLRFVAEMMIKIMLWWSGSTNVDFIDNNQWFSSNDIINHEEWKKQNLYPPSSLFADDSRSKSNIKLSFRHWLNPNMLTLRFWIFFGQRWADFVGPLYFLYTFLMMFRFVISNCRVPPKTYYVITSVTKNPVSWLLQMRQVGFP